MKYFTVIVIAICMFACKEEPHLKHTIAYKKVSDSCASGMWNYKLISNTIGERYEFNQCLVNTYKGTYTLVRTGDTIRVTFPVDTTQTPKAVFAITLDVDTWPKYGHIYLGEQLLKVGQQ